MPSLVVSTTQGILTEYTADNQLSMVPKTTNLDNQQMATGSNNYLLQPSFVWHHRRGGNSREDMNPRSHSTRRVVDEMPHPTSRAVRGSSRYLELAVQRHGRGVHFSPPVKMRSSLWSALGSGGGGVALLGSARARGRGPGPGGEAM